MASPLKFRQVMFFITSLRLIVPLLFASSFTLAAPSVDDSSSPACTQIDASISFLSNIYYPGTNLVTLHHTIMSIVLTGDPTYSKGVLHWANYTSQAVKCVVEPGTTADVGIIVRTSFLSAHPNSRFITPKLGIVGKTRTPFTVSHIDLITDVYLRW